MNRLKKAHDFAVIAHGDQKRKFIGEPYLIHLEETARLLWEATEGQATTDAYIAAILHDTVEDTATKIEDIGINFGGVVMGFVLELTNNDAEKEAEGKRYYLARKMNAMSETALTIKLCDRLHNVVSLNDSRVPKKFISKYVKETHYILEHLNRKLNESQKNLTKKIEKMLVFLKLNRSL